MQPSASRLGSVRAAAGVAPVSPAGRLSGGELSLAGVLALVRLRWWLIAATCGLAVAIVAVLTLRTERTYSSEARFMPQDRRSASALSGLAAQFGVAVPGGEASQSPAFYVDLVQSRAILEQLAESTFVAGGRAARPRSLEAWYGITGADSLVRRNAVVGRLAHDLSARVAGGTGVITLTARAPRPELAPQIADRVLALLDQFNREKRQSQAAAERAFTERRVAEVRLDLRAAEDRLRAFQDANRGFRDAPALRLAEDRLRQDVALQQQLYATLRTAYEQARIDEVRDTPLLTILERPETPLVPDSRHMVLKAALAGMFGLLLGLCIAFVREVRPFAEEAAWSQVGRGPARPANGAWSAYGPPVPEANIPDAERSG